MHIKVTYSTIDRFRKVARFVKIENARAFAHKWVGPHPEIGSGYVVSGDGIGKIQVEGATLAELFPERTI